MAFRSLAPGLTTLVCRPNESVIDANTGATLQLLKNAAPRDMSDLDIARSIQRLMYDRQCTGAEVANALGRSTSWVSRKLSLLKLTEADQAKLATGEMPKMAAMAAVVKRRKARKERRRKPLTVKQPDASRRRKPLSKKRRFEVLKRCGFRCHYCGARGTDGVELHVDHVHPVSKGGDNSDDNLVAACRDCNLGKGAREIKKYGR